MVYFDDKTKSGGLRWWKSYGSFYNEFFGKLFYAFFRRLCYSSEETETMRRIALMVKRLDTWLKKAMEEKQISATLWGFQADVVIYKTQDDYFLGIDVCMSETNTDVARQIAKRRGLRLSGFRLFHGSLVKDIKNLNDPQEIVDAIIEYNNATRSLDKQCLSEGR